MLWSMSGAGAVAATENLVTASLQSEETNPMDEAAFRELYARTARQLWSYLARATGSDSTADDLLQDTYYRMIRAGFKPDSDDHARNYLFKIAANLVRDYYRSSKRSEQQLEHSPSVVGPEIEVTLRRDVRQVFSHLKPRDRQLLWLGHVEQFSHKEIATILGLKPGSIRLMLFRARRRLADLLEKEDLGPEVLR